MQNDRRMQFEGSPSALACPQNDQRCRLSGPRVKRQHLETAQNVLRQGQQLGQPLGAMNQVQVAPGCQPFRRDLDPCGEGCVLTQGPFPPLIAGRRAGGAVEIGWVREYVIEPLCFHLWRQMGKIRLDYRQAVAARQCCVFCLPLDSYKNKPRHTRAEAQGRSARATAQIQHAFTGFRGNRSRQQDRIDPRPVPLRRLPEMQPSAKKGVFRQCVGQSPRSISLSRITRNAAA